MTLQIKKKFIEDKAIDGEKIELEAGQALKQVSIADGGLSIDLIKLDAEGKVQVATGEVAVKADISSLQEQTSELASSIVSYQQTYLSLILTQTEIDQGYLDFSEDNKTLVQKSTKVFIDRLAIHPELDYKIEDLQNNTYRLHFIKQMYNGVNDFDFEGNDKMPSEEAPEVGDLITLYFQVHSPLLLADSDGNGSLDFVDSDFDGDGVSNINDKFPFDPAESADSDNDGVGDNSDEFPYDASESVDSDGDGVGDNADAFPNDPNFSNTATDASAKVIKANILNGHVTIYTLTNFKSVITVGTMFTLSDSYGNQVSDLIFDDIVDPVLAPQPQTAAGEIYLQGLTVEKKAILDTIIQANGVLTIKW